jgi:HD-GYP domain-containing protein (c-di-GMP phosphodiesterase class II)/DNA-binding CsgD family transcriptional regulator
MRLAELMGIFSVAADTGMGMPQDHGLRSATLSARIAAIQGAPVKVQSDAYYLSLLRFIGCTSDSHLAAEVMGDEIAMRTKLYGADWASPSDFLPRIARAVGANQSIGGVLRLLRTLSKMPKLMNTGRSHCEVGDRLAAEIGFDAEFREALFHTFESWNGRGIPKKLKGEAVALPMRIAQVAEAFEIGHRETGAASARELIEKRSGGALDPQLVAAAIAHVEELSSLLERPSAWETGMSAEPEPRRTASDAEVDVILCALGDFADLKSNFTRGHSRGVAAVVDAAADRLHFAPETKQLLMRAAHVHDLGRIAVSEGIWDKPGPLSDGEWEQVRAHTYVGERVLSRSKSLAPILEIATAAHERLDGSGYHRRLAGESCKAAARVLAAADVFRALTEERPHRPAKSLEEAAATLREMAEAGSLCPDAVAAILDGKPAPTARHTSGLTDREIEVLRLVARGLTNKEVASALDISTKTAGRHLENIFQKIGVTTRAGATMWAMQKGIAV